jgi:hypothetical protein
MAGPSAGSADQAWAHVGLIQVRGVTDVQVYHFNCSNNTVPTGYDDPQVILSCLLLVQEPSKAAMARLHIEDAVIRDNCQSLNTEQVLSRDSYPKAAHTVVRAVGAPWLALACGCIIAPRCQ